MKLRHPSVLSAYAGRNDGAFCKKIGALGLGMVTIGGISVDDISKAQSKKMVKRGRQEFIEKDHLKFIRDQVEIAKESGAKVAVNVRSATLKGYLDAAETISECGAVIEIDAHCRQPELMEVGAGQSLVFDLKKLSDIFLQVKSEFDIETILKFRGNVTLERDIVNTIEGYCDSIHVDAMMQGKNTIDLSVFLNIPDGMFLIGNNSVRDIESAMAVLEYCDAFSFARLANDFEKTKELIEKLL